MVFSRVQARQDAVKLKIRRAMIQAKNPVSSDGTKNDFGVKFPSEVKEAQNKNYVNLTKRIKESVERYQANALLRRKKLAGK